jgi:hypothetical protein
MPQGNEPGFSTITYVILWSGEDATLPFAGEGDLLKSIKEYFGWKRHLPSST